MRRYIKIGNMDPGVRRDVLTGEDVYSSAFLNAEEHFPTGRVEEAWATLYVWIISTPLVLKKKIYPLLRAAFALLGVVYTCAILLDWYFRVRGQ